MSKEDLPGLDVVYQTLQPIAEELRRSHESLSTKAAFMMGFATVSLTALMGLTDKIELSMILLTGVPYVVLIYFAYSAYKDYLDQSIFPGPMDEINQGILQENEKTIKLFYIECASISIQNNTKINERRAGDLSRSLVAFLVLVGWFAFIVIDAEVGVVSYLYDFLTST